MTEQQYYKEISGHIEKFHDLWSSIEKNLYAGRDKGYPMPEQFAAYIIACGAHIMDIKNGKHAQEEDSASNILRKALSEL